jgi:hypothetical protein
MLTSLLRKYEDATHERKYFDAWGELRRYGWSERKCQWNGRLRDLGCGARVGCFGDYLGLPGFDEDDGRDQDDQYRYNEGDDAWSQRRVSCRRSGVGSLSEGFRSVIE